MESSNNLPMITKKVWNMIRVAFFMLRKGISKGKLTMDLNILLRRSRRKLSGKSIANLMTGDDIARLHQFSTTREYEFSCSNTPNNFFSIKRNRRNKFFTRSHPPSRDHDDEAATVSAVKACLEMLNNEVTANASPALPGFGPSPTARQLIRVTDSPFSSVAEEDKDSQVDMAADAFIKRFYKELRKQD